MGSGGSVQFQLTAEEVSDVDTFMSAGGFAQVPSLRRRVEELQAGAEEAERLLDEAQAQLPEAAVETALAQVAGRRVEELQAGSHDSEKLQEEVRSLRQAEAAAARRIEELESRLREVCSLHQAETAATQRIQELDRYLREEAKGVEQVLGSAGGGTSASAELATEAKREWNEVIVRIKALWESKKLKHILEIQEQQFGKEDPDTLNTKIDLAAALQLQKDFTGAQKQLEEVFEALSRARSADLKPQLEEVSKALGRAGPTDLKDDPITRRAVDCFASLLGCLHEDKETVLKEVSKMQSQKLGEEHPLTVNSKADLAVLQERDEQKEAAQVLKEILREPHGHDVGIDFVKDLTLSPGPAAAAKDPEEPVSHAGTTPHDLAKDGDDKKVFVALLSGKDCECLWLQDRTIRQLKEEAQEKLDIAIKHLIGPNMEPLDEEKMLAEENVMPGTTLTVVAVNQAAEDEKEAAECYNDIVRAAFCGQLGAVRHLLRTVPGAVAAKDDSGRTALHAAARDGHGEICRVLLAAKAEVDARDDYYGRTPLHWAVLNGRAEVVKLLLEAKASVTVKDDEGRTPLDDARENGYDEVVKILENAA